ncbi:addiction module toxin RelE [Candidatus Woesearchaeota archaeon]|nr:addiction module toxin RelE [Candidatus Woesearchaeota archaeon]
MSKICKKDKVMYHALLNKMDEIVNCEDVNHYKNLRKHLEEYKRVHIKNSFVLLFKYIPSEDKVILWDLDHHDNVYRC